MANEMVTLSEEFYNNVNSNCKKINNEIENLKASINNMDIFAEKANLINGYVLELSNCITRYIQDRRAMGW